jgi:K+-sensing histidine kinase KdpD
MVMALRRPSVGIGICVGSALLLCLLLNNSAETRFVAPAISLQAVILVALFFGRISALIGSLAITVILVLVLFLPLGSVLINDRAEGAMLALFQLASIVIAMLSPDLRSRNSKPFLF